MKHFFTLLCVLLSVVIAVAQDVTLPGGSCGAAAVTGTWTVPCTVTSLTFHVYGGGGGAGGGGGGSNGGICNTRGGGGGGGGGYTTITINVTPGSSFSYSIGSGGCGGSNGGDNSNGGHGNAGNTTTISGTDAGGTAVNLAANGGTRGDRGNTCSFYGGSGNTGNGGAGGSASGGTTNTTGIAGSNGSGTTGGNGGASSGPYGGAGGVANSGNGGIYGGGGAGGGDGAGGNGGTGAVLITYVTTIPTPVTPTISSTPATCTNDGTSTISNYAAGTPYVFTPAGPTVGAGGLISGMTFGTSYTVTVGSGACATPPSTPFSNSAAFGTPAIPTVTTTPPSCTSDGVSTISNYNAGYTYVFTPTGPTAGAGGTISGMATGTSYTVEAISGGCNSSPSSSFTNGAQFPSPTGSVSGSLTYCTGSNTTLTASGGVSYIWGDAGGTLIGSTASVTVTQGTYGVLISNASGCSDTVITTVTELVAVPATITGTLTYCQGANTTLTASSGVSYVWSDLLNSTTQTITVTQGSYSVTVTDNSGCTSTASATVTETPLPTVSITGTLNYCSGSNTTITANGATSYVWSDAGNSTTPSISVTQGSYTVTGTTNNCTASATATVTEDAAPVSAITGSLSYCTGGNTTLTATGGSTYLWSNAASTASVTVTQGTYTVTVTAANNCTATASVVVTESSSLTINITGVLTHCPGGNTTISASGGTGYLWNDANSSTTPSITVSQGTYSVTVTDATGCTGTANANVTQTSAPAISINGTLSYCMGSNTTITAAGGVGYLWNDAGNSTTPGINVTQGNYTVTGTDANNCTASASVIVSENAPPAVTITGSITYCIGGNTTLTATGGVGYVWTTGATTPSVTVTQGTYTVTATDALGCTGVNSATVTEASSLTVSISGALSYCPNSNTSLTASGGTSYTWSNGNAAAVVNVTQGSYSVTASDASCTGTASAVVTEFSTTAINLGSNITACQDSIVTLDAGATYTSYTWNNGETTQTISPQTTGAYSVTATDANTCTVSSALNVTYQSCVVIDYSVYVPTAFSPNGDGVNDIFRARTFVGVVDFSLRVYNRWGEQVFATNDITAGWDGSYKNQQQPLSNYAWVAEYTFANGKREKQAGNVTLVR